MCVEAFLISKKKQQQQLPISIFLEFLVVLKDHQGEFNLLNKEYTIFILHVRQTQSTEFSKDFNKVQGKLNLFK